MPARSRLFAAFLICSLGWLARGATAETPGIVSEKPATGRYVETEAGYMVPYKQRIPGSDIEFEMTPVPGGVIELGAAEPAEGAELPTSHPIRVRVPPFWIGKHEVSWAEYWRYMDLYGRFEKIETLRNKVAESADDPAVGVLEQRKHLWKAIKAEPGFVDGVTAPTPLYEPPITYKSGEAPELPAVTMSPYAAKQYTKWLSMITGVDHRLPSEAEWEHAALAGGPGPYGMAEGGTAITAESLGDYAWNVDNARECEEDGEKAPHAVGKKLPNAWGLHDMLGNVAEWVLDEFREEPHAAGDAVMEWADAVAWPKESYPRIAKGGACGFGSADCRVVSRLASDDEEWKFSDPNYPLSPWWFTEEPSHGIGFRIVRPLRPMDEDDRRRVWEIDHENIQDDVDTRLEEGRGKLQSIDADLPAALEELDDPEVQKIVN